MSKEETILCASIHVNIEEKFIHQPVNIVNGFVVSGYRHHNCITLLANIYNKYYSIKKEGLLVEGFLTSKNRFVNRYEAYSIHNKTEKPSRPLYSEDLYSEDLY